MKIKKLSIHGFKSFVDKVTLHFPMGTSGIIGPNGCGKSNIVDSIRWVLGEQNARHLRGKHMEDIIFNGSDSRKPLGMAEVVLTFSNEEGQAPARFANFTEIEISRRLYRSGESEYYINKVQSRLRDVVDLFTDTGIGTRAYSIIEQGQVGWLINAKPEERRVILEEAAGINKFKHKKEAALRRLESTKENLTRVNDIISEVKRQLNSLNRQAKKAERYKVLREELKGIELLLSSLELKKLKDELASSVKRLDSIKDEELALTTRIGAKEGLIEEIKAEYDNVEGEYKSIRERVFELERAIQDEEQGGALARMRIDELKRNEERLAIEIEELKKMNAAASEQVRELKAALTEIGSAIDNEVEKLNSDSALLDAITAELKEKEEALRSVQAQSLSLSTRLADLRHSIQSLIREEESLRVKAAKAANQKEAVIKSIESSEGPARSLKDGLASAIGSKEAKEAELKEIKERIASLESGRGASSEALKDLKDEYSIAAARLKTLEDMERNFESLKGGPRAIMLKGEKGGIQGLLADVIEANPGYEKAVEAVLGDRLQYIIVESHMEGIAAIEYLKAHSSGRGSFLPVRDARAGNPVPVQAGGFDNTGAKELAGEVKIKEGYHAIVNCLLGDALIVEDLKSGLELWKRNEGMYKTLVTPEGEMIDAQGIITGGSLSGNDAGILQRRGEIKALKARTLGLEAEIEKARTGLDGIEDGLKAALASLDSTRDALHTVQIEIVNMESGLGRIEAESERLLKEKEALDSESEESSRRLTEITGKKAALSAERESLEKELSDIEGRASALSVEISGLEQRKDAHLGVVTEGKVRLAQARERLDSIKNQIAEKEESIAGRETRLRIKQEEIELGIGESGSKASELEAIKERLDSLLLQVDGIKKQEVSKIEELNALTAKVKDIEAELKVFKSEFSELQELKGELTIEIKEAELSVAHLKERIAERYGSDIESYSVASENESDEHPDMDSLEVKREELREKIAELGEVSLSALEEFNDLERRHQFLLDQQADLTKSVEALHAAITRINRTTREKFKTTFDEVNEKFKETFPKFFNGGKAELRLSDDGDILEAGVEIVAQPPGKRLQNITLLSGGEKALTATSLIFAIFLIKPSPFCLLDEVDAPLDDANIDRFNFFVKEMAKNSQFMLITHNKKTMEMADALYGITMEEPGVSKIISVKF